MQVKEVYLDKIVSEYNDKGCIYVDDVENYKYNLMIDRNDHRVEDIMDMVNVAEPIRTSSIITEMNSVNVEGVLGNIWTISRGYLEDSISNYTYFNRSMLESFKTTLYLYNIMLYLSHEKDELCTRVYNALDNYLVFHFNNIIQISGLKSQITSFTEDILDYMNMEFLDTSLPIGSMVRIANELDVISNGVIKAITEEDFVIHMVKNKQTEKNRVVVDINVRQPVVFGTFFNIPGCVGNNLFTYSTGKQIIKPQYKEYADLSSIVNKYGLGYFLLYCNNPYRSNKCVYVIFNKLTNQFTLLV